MAEELDLQAAHRRFSAECFNRAWDLLDKSARSVEEDEKMLLLGLASLWHWSERADCTPTNLSIGCWQVSRIYAVLGQAENARRYALRCLDYSRGEDTLPFYLGYAYEALARAKALAGNRAEMEQALAEAHLAAARMSDLESQKQLLDDLNTIRLA